MSEENSMDMPAISTRSGRRLYIQNPIAAQIDIEDIAHGLANQCRFNGQTSNFYSVAQHSVIVASILPPELKLAGLLHDASEAYLGDIVQPLKELLPEYSIIESKFNNVIGQRFNVDLNHHDQVKKADLIALATERRDLMPMEIVEWSALEGINPLLRTIKPQNPMEARQSFLDTFFKLTEQKKKVSHLKMDLNFMSVFCLRKPQVNNR